MTAFQDSAARPAQTASRTDHLAYIDALRVVLIVLVIAHHSVESYVSAHPAEIVLPDPPIPSAWVFLWVNAAFFMGAFFFLAGYFTADPFDRKGVATFLRERGRRLGWPLLLGILVLVPFADWMHAASLPTQPRTGYWTFFTRDFLGLGQRPDVWPPGERWPLLNLGHLWFIEHLLVYALLYAALRTVLPRDRGTWAAWPPSHAAIFLYAALLSVATWAIRIRYPQDAWIAFLGFIQMEPAHFPQYASLFVLGVIAGPRRWIETMPARRGFAWLAAGVAIALLAWLTALFGPVGGTSGSGSWRVCISESFLCAGMVAGLPVLFRELSLGTGRLWRVLARNVLAVYVFHFPIVLMLQWALIEAPVPKWLRLLATILAAVAASFAFTNWVVLRLPYARRIF